MATAHGQENRSPQPEQVIVAAQRPLMQRSAPRPPVYPSGRQESRTQQQQQSAEAYTAQQLRRAEMEVEHMVRQEGMRMDMQKQQTTSQEVVSVEEILSMWGEQGPSVEARHASGARRTLQQSAHHNLQAAEDSLHRLEQLQRVSACLPLTSEFWRAQHLAFLTVWCALAAICFEYRRAGRSLGPLSCILTWPRRPGNQAHRKCQCRLCCFGRVDKVQYQSLRKLIFPLFIFPF